MPDTNDVALLITTIVTSVLGGIGTLWGVISKLRTDREKTIIDQYRQFIDDQRTENQQLRERVAQHSAHMDNLQGLVNELHGMLVRCRRDFKRFWATVCEQGKAKGLDFGPPPDSLLEDMEVSIAFQKNTAAQNTELMRQTDTATLSAPKSPPIPPKGAL